MLSTGISGSGTSASSAQMSGSRPAAETGSITADMPLSPPNGRIGALQMLHLREHVPQVLGVHAAPAMPGVRLRRRPLEGRGTQILIDARQPALCKLGRRGRDSRGLHAFIDVIGREQFRGEAPQGIERCLNTVVTLLGSVAEAYEPAAAEALVIAGLPERLGGDGAESPVRGPLQALVDLKLPGIEQPLAHHRMAKVAVWLLGECQVGKLRRITQKGQRVLVTPAALELARVGEQQPRLSDQIEGEVGEPQVLLERRRVTHPLAEALPEHETRVTEAQNVVKVRLLLCRVALVRRTGPRAHRFLTSSGIT